MHLIEKMDEARVDALLTLLENPKDDLYVSEDDWAQIEYRMQSVKRGKSQLTDAREAGKKVLTSLKKRKK